MAEFAWAIAMLIASYFITRSMMPRPEDTKPTAFEDLDMPQADEGTPQIVVFGDCWIEDWTVLWYGNYRTVAIRGGGGKK